MFRSSLSKLLVCSRQCASTRLLSSSEIQSEVLKFSTEGAVAAPFTPFKSNGEIDFDKFDTYIDHLLEFECKNVFVMGTTGEGLSMTVEERKAVAEKWVQAKSRLSKVVVQIGAGNLTDSQELAEHAHSIGADAISCVAPSYYRPQTEEQLVEYMKNVAACAPDKPFYLYDIDFMTNIYLNMERFFTLADGKIPTLRGIKYSSPHLPGLVRCLSHSGGKWHVMIGTDDQYLMGLAVGSYTSVPSSYLTPTHHRMYHAFMKGDMETARNEQDRCLQVSKLRGKYGGGPGAFPVARSVLPMLGVDIGPPRLPLTLPSSDDTRQLEQDLTEIGFFDWAK